MLKRATRSHIIAPTNRDYISWYRVRKYPERMKQNLPQEDVVVQTA